MNKKIKVTRDEVIKIAGLAKLSLSEDEIEKHTHQMNQMLDYMDQINELDLEEVEPLSHVLDQVNVTREDKPALSLRRDDALKNAPKADGEHFIVPTVVKKS